MSLQRIIVELNSYKLANPNADKALTQIAFLKLRPEARKERSVYVTSSYAIRFSEANTDSFSNVVLSLSALAKYDEKLPVVLCIVRKDRLQFKLINSSLLQQISHSSKNLTCTNIKGSFLGHDIVDVVNEIPNSPEYFDDLYSIHQEFSWNENLERLVLSTAKIKPTREKFDISDSALATIMDSPSRANKFINSTNFNALNRQLLDRVAGFEEELLEAAETDNVNLRGNYIEQIITDGINTHGLGDLNYDKDDQSDFRISIDIKTKLSHLSSAPKAYNIDKMLDFLSKPDSCFMFLFIGIDIENKIIKSKLVSIFDKALVPNTVIQSHWAGRASRGVTQFTGSFGSVLLDTHIASIDIEAGKSLLDEFLRR